MSNYTYKKNFFLFLLLQNVISTKKHFNEDMSTLNELVYGLQVAFPWTPSPNRKPLKAGFVAAVDFAL